MISLSSFSKLIISAFDWKRVLIKRLTNIKSIHYNDKIESSKND